MPTAGQTLVDDAPVILCLGSGGVDKTTTAAAIGVAAASRGRRVVVVTIDPARRLADAMGLTGGLGNEPAEVEGPWSGELWATMLDPGATFDDLIRQYATTDAQASTILGNRLYRNLTEGLSGTNEYMAAERLRSLHLDPRFDLVVVDTPPTKHAFDFLDSPARLARFFDHRLYRAVLAPRSQLVRAVSAPSRLVLKTLSRFVGAAFVEDVIEFFEAFRGIDDGFRDRALEVERLLTAGTTRYVVVTAARSEPLAEAVWISERLDARDRSIGVLVVNRRTPDFGPPTGPPGPARQNLEELGALVEAERVAVERVAQAARASAVLSVEEQISPVADLDGLMAVGQALLGDEPARS